MNIPLLLISHCLSLTSLHVATSRAQIETSLSESFTNVYEHSTCAIHVQQNSVLANCSWRALLSVPRLPVNTTTILLDHNNIRSMNASSLQGMVHLQSIDISYNPLVYISMKVFKGLPSLRRVRMKESLLHRQSAIDFNELLSDVPFLDEFVMLFSYQPVLIHCNRKYLPFRNAQVLVKVVDLDIDVSILEGLDNTVSITTSKFTKKLTIRDEGHVCLFKEYQMGQLGHFSTVQELEIYSIISYAHASNDSLSLLHDLKQLTIHDHSYICKDPDVNISNNFEHFLLNVTSSLAKLKQFNELKLLGKYNFCTRYKLQGLAMNPELIKSKSLKTLTLDSLGVRLPSRAVISNIPPSVTTLQIGGNCLEIHNVMYLMDVYPSIKSIYARNAPTCHVFDGSPGLRTKHTSNSGSSKLQNIYVSRCLYGCSDFYFQRHCPPRIKRLELSWFLDFENLTDISEYLTGCPGVEYLDFTGCKISSIDAEMFKGMKMLKNLQLSENNIGEMKHNLCGFMKSLDNLEVFNLAYNRISEINQNAFENMKELRVLDLSVNNLKEFLPSLMHINFLQLLNLSYNHLNTLSVKTLGELDSIALFSPVLVDITGNPLLCVCKTLSFLTWILHTHVRVHKLNELTCLMANGTTVYLDKLQVIVENLQLTCVSKTALYIAVSSAAVLTIVVVTAALVYRYRWRLRYLYYMAKLKFSDSPAEYERIFEYDAFISYATDDHAIARTTCIEKLEDREGLKLFIHERDFEAGTPIGYNISVGIHACRHTILFISSAFIKSKWCLYELNIAREESLYTNRKLLLIVILEKAVIKDLPLDILHLIRKVTYLEYPEHRDEKDLKVFWKRLAHFVRGN